ncbi:hypothetical protein ACFLYU_00515 [Candidatus Dependentiae bacterium]
MRLIEFIDKINTKSPVFSEHVLFHFKSSSKGQYPLLFFSFFIKKLKVFMPTGINGIVGTEAINLAAQNASTVKSKLETTFLGQKKFYWLEDVSALKAKDKSSWVAYLKNYTGPNLVAFYSDSAVKLGLSNKNLVIEIDPFVDQRTFIKLVQFCAKPKTKSFNKIILDMFSQNSKLTLDLACILMNYASLAGRKYKDFCDSWLVKIITPEKSLFTLAQYFFNRNPHIFFKLWRDLKDDYPEQFWITYWSEQIWRASNVIVLMQERKIADARKISFRLPFSFMQRSWRNFSFDELSNAHNFLYSIDYSLKNGGDPFSLDLFYSKFFAREFCP